MSNHCDLTWFNGEIMPFNKATTNVMSHALHYGSGVFEGIKCYKTHSGPALFKLDSHINRLYASAEVYKIDIPYSFEEIKQGCLDLVRHNNIDNGYIRPIAFYSYDSLAIHPKECPITVSIAAFYWGAYLGQDALKNGISVTISPWKKFHSSSFPTTAKACGQYLNSLLAVRDANDKGYDEALLLNQEGTIAEGAGQNIFLVKDGELFTNTEDSSILMGITRDTIIQLAKNNDINVNICRLSLEQLFNADEAFFTGTASEVTPISIVDGLTINNGKPGPLTKKLQRLYLDIVHGKIKIYNNWLTYTSYNNHCAKSKEVRIYDT